MMKKLFVIFLVLMIFAPAMSPALAQNPCSSQIDNPSLPRCINQIYLWSLGIAAILAVLMVIFGGYMVMTSAGNAQQASSGKEMIWAAIIGLGILFGAFLILSTINPDLVDFSGLEGDVFSDVRARINPREP